MTTRLALIAALLALPVPSGAARAQQAAPQVGDTAQILRHSESTEQREGSTSTSSDSDALIERVIAVRPDGLELEYDLPQGNGDWKFPVRVFKPARGPLQLLNRKELEARVDGWLRQGGMTRAACGHWAFGWNAFRIECDPQAALEAVRAFQLEPDDLREGAAFSMPGARGSAPLVKKGGTRFTVELPVDPELVRKGRVESDLAAAEINRAPLTPEAARRAHAGDAISGTITIGFDLDPDGHVQRRTEVSKIQIKGADGHLETHAATTILERRPKAKPPRDPRLI